MAPPRLLGRVREGAQLRHLSPRAEKAYVSSIRRYVPFRQKRHPWKMGASEVASFLANLAVELRMAASTQAQALAAFTFLCRGMEDSPRRSG